MKKCGLCGKDFEGNGNDAFPLSVALIKPFLNQSKKWRIGYGSVSDSDLKWYHTHHHLDVNLMNMIQKTFCKKDDGGYDIDLEGISRSDRIVSLYRCSNKLERIKIDMLMVCICGHTLDSLIWMTRIHEFLMSKSLNKSEIDEVFNNKLFVMYIREAIVRGNDINVYDSAEQLKNVGGDVYYYEFADGKVIAVSIIRKKEAEHGRE